MPVSSAAITLVSRLQIWKTILSVCIEERLVYRVDFALGTLMRFLPIVTQIFLWGAIFDATQRATLAGYSYPDFVAYYLLTMIGRAFSSMPGLASGIARQIRQGEIKKYLIQPVDMIGFLLLSRMAHKLVYYLVAFLPFALVFYLCGDFFPAAPPLETWAAFVLSLVLAFLLGFFIEATLGMIGFWFLEVSSLLFVYMLLSFFLSGHMFPLDMLKGVRLWGDFTVYSLVQALPLQYLAYFPSAVFLGKVRGPELVQGMLIQAAWTALFILACRAAYYRGLKRYSAYGG
ncbi:MAG: ABC-2 family transporter protein [Planctomycetia bacterium]|nr:ABC-2 family transporter protein [Planctomycetia bacterium]